jgi:DNA-directed RNA polymerase specialized sigma24 family protein
MITKTLSASHDVVEDLPGLYEDTFPAVASFVAKMGGTIDDAKDIFHDALIAYMESASRLKFSVEPGAYIVGIAKHLWLRKYKRDAGRVDLDDIERQIVIADDTPLPVTQKVYALLQASGKACLELLQAFYYRKQDADEIAQSFNFSNARSATVQKFKCVEKLRDTVRKKSLNHEDFLD